VNATALPTAHVPLDVEEVRVALGGRPVLHGVSLSVPAGRTLAVLGASGCGKTTLLRCVAGLQRPDAGRVLLDGQDVTDVPPERRGVGMVFQDGALFPHLTVAGNVGFGLPRRDRRGPAVDAALDLVGLGGMGSRMPSTLSGGQQQRVALARALAARPRVLLLDEPFASLDAALRASLRAEVAALLRELAVTAVVVTHDQEEAFVLGDEVAVVVDGRIHQQASPEALYAAPATRDVACFLGDANLVPAHAEGSTAATWFGDVPLRRPARGPVELLVRPEHLLLSAGPGAGGAAVVAVEFYGHDAVTILAGPTGPVRVRTLQAPDVRPGDRVALRYAGPAAAAYAGDPGEVVAPLAAEVSLT
jgi:iron(III) transport system ATP-binding protein